MTSILYATTTPPRVHETSVPVSRLFIRVCDFCSSHKSPYSNRDCVIIPIMSVRCQCGEFLLGCSGPSSGLPKIPIKHPFQNAISNWMLSTISYVHVVDRSRLRSGMFWCGVPYIPSSRIIMSTKTPSPNSDLGGQVDPNLVVDDVAPSCYPSLTPGFGESLVLR